jgi:heme/copper-type cytochrome/quinol oxidase subunit 3
LIGMAPTIVARTAALEKATRVAVVAALSATTMLFASLASAYLVRRSFADWRPSTAAWPFLLLGFGLAASVGIEVAARSLGRRRRQGFIALASANALYLLSALSVLVSIARGEGGLTAPWGAFVALLLGLHLVHALIATGFAAWILREAAGGPEDPGISLARLVTHFLTALLGAIIFILFVLR